MDFSQIETALGQRLRNGLSSTIPIAWQNDDFTPGTVPYVEFVHSPTSRDDDTITGNYAIQLGLCIITVVAPRGQFTTASLGLAKTIAALYPKGLRLAAGTGTVLIYKPTDIVPGFVDGTYWRQPLRVSYMTEGR